MKTWWLVHPAARLKSTVPPENSGHWFDPRAPPAASLACGFPPARRPAAAYAGAGGPEGHPRMGASMSSRCSGTGRAPSARPARPAPPAAPATPRSPHPGQRTTRNPGQEAATRTRATIIQATPAPIKEPRQQTSNNPSTTERQRNAPKPATGECLPASNDLCGSRPGRGWSAMPRSTGSPGERRGML